MMRQQRRQQESLAHLSDSIRDLSGIKPPIEDLRPGRTTQQEAFTPRRNRETDANSALSLARTRSTPVPAAEGISSIQACCCSLRLGSGQLESGA